MAYKFVGIDPGHSTGIAVVTKKLNQTYVVLVHQTVATYTDLIAVVDRHECGYPSMFVIESPPYNSTDRYSLGIYWALHQHLRDKSCGTLFISPGLWKPVAKAQRWPRPKGWSRHEIDAYNLIRYHLFIQGVDHTRIQNEEETGK